MGDVEKMKLSEIEEKEAFDAYCKELRQIKNKSKDEFDAKLENLYSQCILECENGRKCNSQFLFGICHAFEYIKENWN